MAPDVKDPPKEDRLVPKDDTKSSKDAPKTKIGYELSIKTAEDAAMAYLRELIDEATFREYCGLFGVLPGTLLYTNNGNSRIDAAFVRSIPEDLYDPPGDPDVPVEERVEAANKKTKEREEATKKAEEETKDVQSVKIVQG